VRVVPGHVRVNVPRYFPNDTFGHPQFQHLGYALVPQIVIAELRCPFGSAA
jgi:hypothetical protein